MENFDYVLCLNRECISRSKCFHASCYKGQKTYEVFFPESNTENDFKCSKFVELAKVVVDVLMNDLYEKDIEFLTRKYLTNKKPI